MTMSNEATEKYFRKRNVADTRWDLSLLLVVVFWWIDAGVIKLLENDKFMHGKIFRWPANFAAMFEKFTVLHDCDCEAELVFSAWNNVEMIFKIRNMVHVIILTTPFIGVKRLRFSSTPFKREGTWSPVTGWYAMIRVAWCFCVVDTEVWCIFCN